MKQSIVALLFAALVSACSAPAAVPTPTDSAPPAVTAAATVLPGSGAATAAPPFELPPNSPDVAVVGGRILARSTNGALAFVRVAFAEVIRSGDEAIYFDDPLDTPAVEADAQGIFIVNDIPPGEYVIVVGDPMGYNVLVTEADGVTPLFVTLSAGERRHFGELLLDIEP